MMVNFDFLSSPIEFREDKVSVLCIENKEVFRKTVFSFYSDCIQDESIVFSQDFRPFKYKGNVCFVSDLFNLDFSAAFIKKIYEDIAKFCVNELIQETSVMKHTVLKYFENIIENYDFDFSCKSEIELTDMFKMMGVKPNLSGSSIQENLIDYIFLMQKYTPQKCFVILNLHLYLSKKEIDLFYTEILRAGIKVLILESTVCFEKSEKERVVIIDEDLCEIVDF